MTKLRFKPKNFSNKIIMTGMAFAVLSIAISGMKLLPEAAAHISPANCSANNLTVNIAQSPGGTLTGGQTVNYTVSVSNPTVITSCDTTAVGVTLITPDGVSHTLCDPLLPGQTPLGCNFPADGSGDTVYPPVSYKVKCPADAPSITATVNAKGTLHDSTGDDPFNISKSLSSGVSCPPPPTIGGEILPTEMMSLFIAGATANVSWMIPTLVAAIGGAAATAVGLRRRRAKN